MPHLVLWDANGRDDGLDGMEGNRDSENVRHIRSPTAHLKDARKTIPRGSENTGARAMIYRNYPYIETEESMKELARQAGLKFKATTIKIEYPDDISDVRKHGTESERHRLLKKFMLLLLQRMGDWGTLYEHLHDVYSPKFQIGVECGNTTTLKVIESMNEINNASLKEVWFLDYPKKNNISDLWKIIK